MTAPTSTEVPSMATTVAEVLQPIEAEKRRRLSLPKLAPVVLVDSREQCPLRIEAFPTERQGLKTGDYSIKGFEHRFIVERKSLPDLVGSLTSGRERFFNEIDRMAHVAFPLLLIEADRAQVETHGYRSQATPQSILASLDAIMVRTPVKIEWAGDAENAARRLEDFVKMFVRGIEKDYRALTQGVD